MDIQSLLNSLFAPERASVAEAIEELKKLDPLWKDRAEGRAALAGLRDRLWRENAYEREISEWALSIIGDEETFHCLLEVLRGHSWKNQQEAAKVLGMMGDSRAVEPLVLAFLEGKWPVPRAAAAALEKIDPLWPRHLLVRAAVSALIPKLRAEKFYVRQRAAWALGKMQNPEVVPAIAALLEDSEPEVRGTAVKALEALGVGEGDQRWGAAKELARPTSRLVMSLGEEDLAALVVALKSVIPIIRKRAVYGLAQLGLPEAIEPLTESLADPDKEVRAAALEALGQLSWTPRNDHEKALSCIISEDWSGAAAIGHSALPALLAEIARGNSKHRRRLAAALGMIGEEEAISALVNLIRDSDGEVRQSAIASLDLVGWRPRSDEELVLLALAWGIWEQAALIGKAAVPQLLALLQVADPKLQTLAARALGEIRDLRAVGPLTRMLASEPHVVADAAGHALVRIGGEESRRALLEMLRGHGKPLAARAARLLGEMDVEEAAEGLTSARLDPDIGPSAAYALRRITSPSVDRLLVVALGGEDERLRSMAAELLGERGAGEFAPTLQEVLLHDPAWKVRRAAGVALKALKWTPEAEEAQWSLALALGEMEPFSIASERAVEFLLSNWRSGLFGNREKITKTLGTIGGVRVVQSLIAAVLNETDMVEVRAEAAEALGAIGDPSSILPLFAVARDGVQKVSHAALVALDAINADWRSLPVIADHLSELIRSLGDADTEMRVRAVQAIGNLRLSGSVRQLAILLEDADWIVREEAMSALREIGRAGGVEALEADLSDLEEGLRLHASRLLRGLAVKPWEGGFLHSIGGSVAYRAFIYSMDHGRFPPRRQISVWHPHEVNRGLWYPMVAYIYKKGAEGEVEVEMRGQLGSLKARMRHLTTEAKRALEQGAEITATPRIPGILFNPVRLTVPLYDDYQRFDFKLMAESAEVNRSASGTLTMRCQGVVVAVLALSVFVGTRVEVTSTDRVQSSIWRKLFACYSHADSRIVERVERISRILGIEFLRDATALRSGEVWSERLLELIQEADVFQLFWSHSAARSPNVKKEINFAAGLRRPNFIWPVYWEAPPPPFPRVLRKLHFHFEPDLAGMVE